MILSANEDTSSISPLPRSQVIKFTADIRRQFDEQKNPPQGLEAEQQAACHLVGSRCGDHLLVRCQDVVQAAIARSLLIDRSTACRLADELHQVAANSNRVRI